MQSSGTAQRQWDCHQLLVRLFHLLDAKRYEELVGLFQEDGVWVRPGPVMHGRAEISEAMRQRPAHRVTRHLVSNFLVLEDGDQHVDAVAHLTTYAFAGEAVPVVANGPIGIFMARVQFLCSAGELWVRRLELAPDITLRR